MKLLIVTSVSEYHSEVNKLFKKAGIEKFSSSDIDGFQTQQPMMAFQSWFPAEHNGMESMMYFSFTDANKIDVFFEEVTKFNSQIDSNPVRAVVVPIERSI